MFVPHNGSATHYGRVCGIYDSGVVSTTLEKDSGLTKASALNPIPLTQEILEKNGWCSRLNGTGEFYLKKKPVGAVVVTKAIIGFQMNHGPFSGLAIYYVHQLQHAIRLCGIEKEITI